MGDRLEQERWEFVSERREPMHYLYRPPGRIGLVRHGVSLGDRTIWLCRWRGEDSEEAAVARERARLIAAAPRLYVSLKWTEQPLTGPDTPSVCRVCGQRPHSEICPVGTALAYLREGVLQWS